MNSITQESMEVMKGALANPDDRINKSINLGTGLVAYDLQAPAKNLYPFLTPLRNVIPRVGGGVGAMTNWRQVNAIIGSTFSAMGWVPEGQRSAQMSYNTSNVSAAYQTLGEEDQVTFEAISAGRTFEDLQATMAFRLLQMMMLKEENAILAGNGGGVQLGTPGTPSLSAAGTGATLPALTYSVIVVALTTEGFLNSSLTGGVATQISTSGADNKTFVINGGSSNKSASATQAVTLGQTLSASVAPVVGAAGYAWYVGGVGAETLQAITTINSATFSAPLAGGRQAATAVTADHSWNDGVQAGGTVAAYNGLLTTALHPGSNAYVNTLATGTPGTGTFLTASGRGSVNEIDTMFQTMWQNFELSPTVLYVNAQELRNITNKVLSNASGPLVRYEVDGEGGGEYQITASGVVAYYYNPFAIQGGLRIPIRIHPRLPPGTMIGWAENLPIQYQSNEVPNVAEVKTRQDYSRWVH